MSYYIPQERQQNYSEGIDTEHGVQYSSASQPIIVNEKVPLKGGDIVDVKFQPSPCRDLFWAILFVIHLLGFIAVLAAGQIMAGKPDVTPQEIIAPLSSYGFRVMLATFGSAAGAGIVLSFLWMIIVRYFARTLIIITLVFSVAIVLVNGIIFWVKYHNIFLAILMIVMAAIYAFVFFTWRTRIPFATAMLKTMSDLIHKYPATVAFAYLSLVLQLGWTALWVWAVVNIQYFSPNVTYVLLVFLVLSFYWVSQVLKNLVHVTAAGTFATWYFMGENVPSNPTVKSLVRASTTSFGSICLGSLLVSILQTLRWIAHSLRRSNNNWLACFAECILGCLESLLNYFNMYAYTQVAIYGKSYCHAAKDTWRLIGSHGIEAIINDNIVGGVLGMGAFLIGMICGLVGVLVGVTAMGDYLILCVIVSFFIGYVIATITMSVVESGVLTIFVCFAMDPAALQRSNPELYNKFQTTYFM